MVGQAKAVQSGLMPNSNGFLEEIVCADFDRFNAIGVHAYSIPCNAFKKAWP